jgi:hypothetical protein
LALSLTGLTGDADVYLLNSNGTEVAHSYNFGTAPEAISLNNLATGTYYVQVRAYQTASTNYNLDLSTGSVVVPADLAGNTLAAARVVTLGSATSSYTDYVGPADTIDYYKFITTGPTNLALSLTGLTGDADVYLLNSNGTEVAHSYNFGTAPEAISINNLATGAYYVQVRPYQTASTNYTLGLSAAPLQATGFTATTFDYDSARYGDFNKDGRADILFQNDNPAEPAVIWQTDSAGAFTNDISLGPVPSGFRIDGTGNFNSTAGDDILLRSPTSVAVWVMDGTTPQSVAPLGGTSPEWLNSGIGDFTGDGQSDLLFRNVNTGEIATWGVANNALSTTPKVLGSAPIQYHIVAVDDFTGDQQADILFRNDTGDIAIWRVANNALAGVPAIVGSTATNYHVVGTGDFDGNGANDILFRNDNGDLTIWLLNSQGQLLGAPADIGNPGLQYHVNGTGDLNGDGRSDIILRDEGGSLVEWLMNGTSFAAPPTTFAASTLDHTIAAHHFDLV